MGHEKLFNYTKQKYCSSQKAKYCTFYKSIVNISQFLLNNLQWSEINWTTEINEEETITYPVYESQINYAISVLEHINYPYFII